MGRPKKLDGVATTITARVTKDLADEVRRTAEVLGMGVSDYIRSLAEEDITTRKSSPDWQRRVVEHNKRQIAELEEEIAALKERQRSLKAR